MNKKLWIWFSAVFAVFTATVAAVLLTSEYHYKEAILSSRLEGYADIVSRSADYDKITELFPKNIRVTVIRTDGSVVFDTYESADSLSNHLSRPEIASCLHNQEGSAIRYSQTAGIEYIYYAHRYGNLIVRTALPFELPQRKFLHPDWMVLFAIFILFLVTVFVIIIISRRFNAEVNRLTDQMLQSQKKHMTNNIAHELRTPVTSIRGYLETLVNNPTLSSDKRSLFTERAYLQTLRLSDLIRDISLITKIEEAPELLMKEYIHLRRISEEVLEEFSKDIADKNITVENMIPADISIKGNQSLLYALLRNLIENTLRYAGEGVTIHLECSNTSDGTIHCTYYDTGKGVAESHLTKIFERFYRIPEENAHRAEGSGLGLSIVKNAILFHGGTIHASNLHPHGLCFKFTLKRLGDD